MEITENYYTYILKCSDGTFYTGQTKDLKKRLSQHNGAKAGAWYTKFKRPVELVYCETFTTRKEAMQREAAIKKLKRDQKESLCSTWISSDKYTKINYG